MQGILEFLRSDQYLILLGIILILLFIGLIVLLVVNIKIKNNYKKFIDKLGNGKSIQENIEKYINKVEEVEKQNFEIKDFCKILDNDISKCIQKVGIVRYSAFKDTGSDLSFAVALLDDKNNGIVFNGIYSREMSNIYAKPVEKGNSKYTLSEEEIQAIERAINSNSMYIESRM